MVLKWRLRKVITGKCKLFGWLIFLRVSDLINKVEK